MAQKVIIPTNLGQVKQGVAVWLPIYYVNDAEEFVAVAYTDVQLFVIKPNGSFILIPLSAGIFNAIGGAGIYQVLFPASAVDTVGQLMIYTSHSDFVSTREMNFLVQVVANTNDDLASDIAAVDTAIEAIDLENTNFTGD